MEAERSHSGPASDLPGRAPRLPGNSQAAWSWLRDRDPVTAVVVIFVGGYLVYALYALYTLYVNRAFGFHDLSQYNDFLANTILRGRFFYISDYDQSHFTYHLTPTLILLTPLYLVFSSQFVGVALGALCMAGVLIFSALILKRLFEQGRYAKPGVIALYMVTLLFVIAFNTFSINVVTAAHWHPVFTLLAVALLYLLVSEAPVWRIAAVTALVLGVRQDAGFFLLFPLASLLFLPRDAFADRRRLRRRAMILCAVCLVYTLVAVTVVFPLVGGREAHQLAKWSKFGGSWEEIFANLFLRPDLLAPRLEDSAFELINRSFAYIHLLNPPVGVLANLSALLMYVADHRIKTHLLGYTASLVLPAFFLALAAGLLNLQRLARFVVGRLGLRASAIALVPILLFPAVCYRVRRDWRRNTEDLVVHSATAARDYVGRFRGSVASCPGLVRVAADFRTVVFLPTSTMKYMLRNYDKADAVIFDPRETAFLSGHDDLESFRLAIRADAGYEMRLESPDMELFVRRGYPCQD